MQTDLGLPSCDAGVTPPPRYSIDDQWLKLRDARANSCIMVDEDVFVEDIQIGAESELFPAQDSSDCRDHQAVFFLGGIHREY